MTAPIYILAALFVVLTVVRAPATLACIQRIMSTTAVQNTAQRSGLSLTSSKSALSITSLLKGKVRSVAGSVSSGLTATNSVAASEASRMYDRSVRSMRSGQKSDRTQHPFSSGPQDSRNGFKGGGGPGGERDKGSENGVVRIDLDFPHLDVDSRATLIKRALVWNVLCAIQEIFFAVCEVTRALAASAVYLCRCPPHVGYLQTAILTV